MQTKITLDLEGDLDQQIVRQKNNLIPPVTQSLIGILQNRQINGDDYKQHLTDKYLWKFYWVAMIFLIIRQYSSQFELARRNLN